MSLAALATITTHCSECRGVICSAGAELHDHGPQCSYWRRYCAICEQPLRGAGARAVHGKHPELCFRCGDLLEASHP